jgi:hypothetical protein
MTILRKDRANASECRGYHKRQGEVNSALFFLIRSFAEQAYDPNSSSSARSLLEELKSVC